MPLTYAPTATLSFTQIQKLWIANGGARNKSVIAAAVAMAESRGHVGAQHRNSNGSIDRGLWQINSVHGAQSTLDPVANAKAAIAISKNGTDWRPWTTFRSGAYIPFQHGHNNDVVVVTPEGVTGDTHDDPISNTLEDAVGAAGAAVPEPLKDLAGFVSRIGVIFERAWWKRVGLILAGALAIIFAVVWFGREFLKDLPIPPIPPL